MKNFTKSLIKGLIIVSDHSFSTFAKFTDISYPLIRTRTCPYQGVRNVSFSENFAYVLNEWSVNTFIFPDAYLGHCGISFLQKQTQSQMFDKFLKSLSDLLCVCVFINNELQETRFRNISFHSIHLIYLQSVWQNIQFGYLQ